MKTRTLLLITILSCFLFIQCRKKKNKSTCTTVKTGAICADNTSSNATGSGACSGHGGVKEWTTKEECK